MAQTDSEQEQKEMLVQAIFNINAAITNILDSLKIQGELSKLICARLETLELINKEKK